MLALQRHRRSRILRNWAKKILVQSGTLRAAARLKAPSAVILAYHSVRDNPEQHSEWIGPGITHATQVFAQQMELVARQFHPVSLDDILLFVQGQKELPRRAVAITFDDGYLDNLEIAVPVLQRFGIPAAFYATVGVIGSGDVPWYSRVRRAVMTARCRNWHSAAQNKSFDIATPSARDKALLAAYDFGAPLVAGAQAEAIRTIERELEVDTSLPSDRLMMNGSELKTLRRAGHIVGSHTLTHPNVAHVSSPQALQTELLDSRRKLEQILQEPVKHFSYPHPALHPQWNQATVEATRASGYSTAVTTTKGPVAVGSNPLLLTRINAPRPQHEFLWNLERAFARGARRVDATAAHGEIYS